MTKNAILALLGTIGAMFFWTPRACAQSYSGTSLTITGTGSVPGTATIDVLTSGTATFNDLTVTGLTDLHGNSLYFGTVVNSGTLTEQAGLGISYNDGTNGTNSAFTLLATRPSLVWNWQRLTASGSAASVMQIDASNRLILTGTAANSPQLVLDPNVLTGPSSLLTQQAADSRYVSSADFSVNSVTSGSQSGFAIALKGGTATGLSSFAGINATASAKYANAIGNYAIASGTCSMAIGYTSTASGYYSTALGVRSTASGSYSFASGFRSKASAVQSIALGSDSTASASYAIALGLYSVASGTSSTALGSYSSATGGRSTAIGYSSTAMGGDSTAAGPYTTASGFNQFVIGQYNILQGNPTTWIPTDELFTIGNGQQADVPSNAFVVKKNGDTTVYGQLTISGSNGSIALTPPGFNIAYTDGTDGIGSSITQQSTRPSTIWNWQRLTASGSAASVMQIDASNRLILTGTAANSPQLVLDPNGASTMNGNNLLTQSAANALYLSATAGLVASNGNVGIGTANPQAKLDVSGSANITGNASINGDTKINGALVVTGTMVNGTVVATSTNQLVLIPQQGDISMGGFTNGTKPQ